jgi:putative transposase
VRPRGRHNPEWVGYRHGVEAGSATLAGVGRRSADRGAPPTVGGGELPVPAYELFSGTELLGELAMERMLAGLSTRCYRAGSSRFGAAVEATATASSKSPVSPRFIAATETTMAELMAADLSAVDLAALMIDGVPFGGHCCIVALGVASTAPRSCWRWRRARPRTPPCHRPAGRPARARAGCHPTHPDGYRWLQGAAAGRARALDHPVIGRCQLHKIRNVRDRLLLATTARSCRAASPLLTAPTLIWHPSRRPAARMSAPSSDAGHR